MRICVVLDLGLRMLACDCDRCARAMNNQKKIELQAGTIIVVP